jgi:hypothetical protein
VSRRPLTEAARSTNIGGVAPRAVGVSTSGALRLTLFAAVDSKAINETPQPNCGMLCVMSEITLRSIVAKLLCSTANSTKTRTQFANNQPGRLCLQCREVETHRNSFPRSLSPPKAQRYSSRKKTNYLSRCELINPASSPGSARFSIQCEGPTMHNTTTPPTGPKNNGLAAERTNNFCRGFLV